MFVSKVSPILKALDKTELNWRSPKLWSVTTLALSKPESLEVGTFPLDLSESLFLAFADLIQPGKVIAIRNGRSEVFKEHMRLEVDRWGKITAEEVTYQHDEASLNIIVL